jgi:hypothetical protein
MPVPNYMETGKRDDYFKTLMFGERRKNLYGGNKSQSYDLLQYDRAFKTKKELFCFYTA